MKLVRIMLGLAFVPALVPLFACSSTPEGDSPPGGGAGSAAIAGHSATGNGGANGGALGFGGAPNGAAGSSSSGGAGGTLVGLGGAGGALVGSGGAGGALVGSGGAGGAFVGFGGRNGAGAGGKASSGAGGTSFGAGGTSSAGASGSGTAGAVAADCPSTPLTGGTQHCSSNLSGDVGSGYQYTIWSSGSGGCMTPFGVGAAFKANWNSSGDFLARVGLALGSNKTYDQLGALSADFAETKTGSAGGYSYVGIYGWSVNPLHEYYIIDDWFGSRPNPGTKVGSVDLDGGTYDILTHSQVNQPAITGGNATFDQFWSLRRTARQCGHISITEHFKAWAKSGMTLGKMEEAKILVEVGGGVGSIAFTKATLVAN